MIILVSNVAAIFVIKEYAYLKELPKTSFNIS